MSGHTTRPPYRTTIYDRRAERWSRFRLRFREIQVSIANYRAEDPVHSKL